MILEVLPWWSWSLILFFFSLILGVLAVVGGVGGGVLFVPIVSALFPFHIDFARGAGLMVALTGALAAAPRLLRSGLSSLRLALPFALIGSIGSIGGAIVGLALPDSLVQLLLGLAILGIVILMSFARNPSSASSTGADALARSLRISGIYVEPTTDEEVDWSIRRTPIGLVVFAGIGFLAGMFGLGAGWANVPALHLLLSAPLKIAVATSGLILSINDTAAVWVYLHHGAVLPVIAVPSVLGMMLGTRLGARILPNARPKAIRMIVILVLGLAAIRQIIGGFAAL